MTDNVLFEPIWVLFAYGLKYLALGILFSVSVTVAGARISRLWSRMALLMLGILVLWIAMFLGVDRGYAAWQSSAAPPDEAFSDTGGPFAFLFAGWIPSGLILTLIYFGSRAVLGRSRTGR